MKSIRKLLAIILFFFITSFAKSQSVNKITVQDALHPIFNSITPDDIAYGGPDDPSNTAVNKLIGYRYRRSNSNNVMGVLGIRPDNSIQFAKTYINTISPNNVFEIAKINPITNFGITNLTYALAGVGNGGSLAYPLILQIDVTTGNIVSQLLLNGFTIPDERFVPCDLNVKYGNAFFPTIIKILCLGRSPSAVPPNPKASIYLIELNITTNSYTVTRLIDNSSLNAYYEFPFNFVKSYHNGTYMYGELSFYGLETTVNGINRGIVYNKDFNTSPACKALILDNATTANIQVNIPDEFNQCISIQNNNLDIYVESNNYLTQINHQNYYRKNFSAPFYLRGTSHGSKSQTQTWPGPIDFFLGQYQQPGMGFSGYSFFRYNHQNGALYQTYNYDLNVDFFSVPTPPSAYMNDDSKKYHSIANSFPLSSQTQQYFYLIENDLVQDQTACVNVPTFNTVNLSVNRQDVIFTSSTVASNLIPSAISISEISVTPPLIAPICSDIGTKPESGKWAQDISLGGMLNGGSSIGGTGGSDFGGNLVSAINELQASLKNNYLKINAGIKKIAQVNVYNATGQLLMKTQDSNSEIELPFKKNLSPSFYLVEIFFTDGSKATKKISY